MNPFGADGKVCIAAERDGHGFQAKYTASREMMDKIKKRLLWWLNSLNNCNIH